MVLDLTREISQLERLIEEEVASSGASPYLDAVGQELAQMRRDLLAPKAVRQRHSTALFRAVTDDYRYERSALGQRLLAFTNAYRQDEIFAP